jgi:hypothetical protein
MSSFSTPAGPSSRSSHPAAPVCDCNPGQNAGSGLAGSGNTVPSGVPRNEGCCDPATTAPINPFAIKYGRERPSG